MKERSNIDMVVATSLGVWTSQAKKMLGICEKGVISYEVSPLKRRVCLGEPYSYGEDFSSSRSVLVEIGDDASSIIKMVAT